MMFPPPALACASCPLAISPGKPYTTGLSEPLENFHQPPTPGPFLSGS